MVRTNRKIAVHASHILIHHMRCLTTGEDSCELKSLQMNDEIGASLGYSTMRVEH